MIPPFFKVHIVRKTRIPIPVMGIFRGRVAFEKNNNGLAMFEFGVLLGKISKPKTWDFRARDW